MTPLERLLAEELPTGAFGGPRPDASDQVELPAVTTTLEAALHRAALEQALHGVAVDRAARHLRAVPDTESEAAA